MGDHYPAGIIVGTPSWANSHSTEIWGDPDNFRPERWIPDESMGLTKEAVERLRLNFHPFSQGPGSCPGKSMALMELSVTIARVFYSLDARKPLVNGTLGEGNPQAGWGKRNPNVFQLKDAYISVREGPMVQFRKRVD